MRPVPDLPSFPPKPSFEHPSPSLDPRTASPATFFLSRNPDASDSEACLPLDEQNDVKDSMYGVQSLGDMLSQSKLAESSPRACPADSQLLGHLSSLSQSSDDMEKSQTSRRRSTIKPSEPNVQDSPVQPTISDTVSRPLTPLNPDDAPSLPSSPKSISNNSMRPLDDISLTDEINSQAIGSGDEDEGPKPSPRLGPSGASQLIMPSIKMPSRRPFTERGKAMGRFKVLVAGASGRLT